MLNSLQVDRAIFWISKMMKSQTDGTRVVARHQGRPFQTENRHACKQVARTIQSLLTLLESFSPESGHENETDEAFANDSDFEVYENEHYRYIEVSLPESPVAEIDIQIHAQRMFVRLEREGMSDENC